MAYWLYKSEPDVFSWDDLVKAGKAGTEWTGVRNYTARNHMRTMKKGDRGFYYHTGDEKAVVGIVEVVKEAHPDFDRRQRPVGLRRHPRRREAQAAGDPRRGQGREEARRDGARPLQPVLGPAGDRGRVESGVQDGRAVRDDQSRSIRHW